MDNKRSRKFLLSYRIAARPKRDGQLRICQKISKKFDNFSGRGNGLDRTFCYKLACSYEVGHECFIAEPLTL